MVFHLAVVTVTERVFFLFICSSIFLSLQSKTMPTETIQLMAFQIADGNNCRVETNVREMKN